jgi:phosphatidylglycerol:prolipoprotein diacylglycerol transferase
MFQGGLLGGFIAAALAIRRRRMSLAKVGDALAPALSLGQALGRAGCLFSGCCYGRPAPHGFPLALVFPAGGGAPPGRPLYPVQPAEGIGLLVLTAVLFRLYGVRNRPRGLVLGAYLFGAGLLRLVMEVFRGDFRGIPVFGLPPTSWAAIVTAVGGIVVIVAARPEKIGPPDLVSRPAEGQEGLEGQQCQEGLESQEGPEGPEDQEGLEGLEG